MQGASRTTKALESLKTLLERADGNGNVARCVLGAACYNVMECDPAQHEIVLEAVAKSLR